DHPPRTMPERPQHLDELLQRQLSAFFGGMEPSALALLTQQLVWVDLPGGSVLMTQGEPGDAMYLLVSGRLRVSRADEAGQEQVLRELTRGQVVGEMSLYTDDPRSATVVAVRDSVL